MAAVVSIGWPAAFSSSLRRECAFLAASPWDLALATWLPWLVLVVLSWLLSGGVPRRLPIAVVDHDRSHLSRSLVRMLDAAPALSVIAGPQSPDAAWGLVRRRDVYAVVYVPRDFTRDVLRGRTSSLFAYYNASYQTAGQAACRDVSAVAQALTASVAQADIARTRGLSAVRPGPVRVQTTFLFNGARSSEPYLLGLLFPAVLHFALCLSLAASFGRELRDGTAGAWLRERGERLSAAVLGKAAPYLVTFTAYGCIGLLWLSFVRGQGPGGSATILVLGMILMFAAYCSAAQLFVGLTKNMRSALSLTSLYAGTALAFSGMTFTLEGASTFVRVWNAALPYTTYLHLQAQQLYAAGPWTDSLSHLGVLTGFLVPGAVGLRLYGRAIRDQSSWGQR